ncbi:MAG: RNA polymerase factor sigma-54, partial [Limisphaerales bacterium]
MHLSQRMALQQVLAPQLQQSLALLQAPILELKALVEQEMQQNPMLEEQPAMEAGQEERRDGEDSGPSEAADPSEPPADVKFDPATESAGTPPDDFQAEFDHLAQVDQEWRDQFSQANAPMRSREEDEEKRQFMFDSLVAGTSLQEHLLEQVRLSELTEEQRPIAEMVVGNIDDRGYLQSGVDELAFATNHPPEQVREVLAVVKMFNPPGVGARDLRECLLLQLERAGRQDSLEYSIIREHMDALGRRRFPEIARTLGKTIEEVQTAVDRISQLDPRPGGEFDRDDNQYVVPEVFVQKVGDPRWTLVTGDIRDLGSITHRLMRSDGSDPTMDFVRRQISPQLLAAPSDGGSREAQKGIKADLVADLNRLIVGEGFPRDLLMKLRDLSDEPKQLLGRKLPAGVNGRLSRRILEDLFPNAIVRSPGTE